jgi:hypothetical protein
MPELTLIEAGKGGRLSFASTVCASTRPRACGRSTSSAGKAAATPSTIFCASTTDTRGYGECVVIVMLAFRRRSLLQSASVGRLARASAAPHHTSKEPVTSSVPLWGFFWPIISPCMAAPLEPCCADSRGPQLTARRATKAKSGVANGCVPHTADDRRNTRCINMHPNRAQFTGKDQRCPAYREFSDV